MKYDNFQQIPERMKAYYRIDVALNSIEHTLEHYTEQFNLNLCPDFQRGHVWTEEQQIAYVEYLLSNPDRDRSTEIIFNCGGWLTNAWQHDMVCVDGLQRITAIKRFLNNEIPVYETYYKDYTGWCSHVGVQFVIGGFKTRKEVLQWYLELNSGGTPHTKEEIERVRNLLKEAENEKA